MKNKFLLTIALATLSLGGCTAATGSVKMQPATPASQGATNVFAIQDFTCAYYSSENEENPPKEGIYLAHCEGDVFVEIPDDYYLTTIELEKTGKIIYYSVPAYWWDVSNKGWEMKK